MDNGFRMTNRQNKKALKVMIIEDEQDILLLYKDYLISRGHNVLVTATSASEIISDYEKILPDIIILDYKLPDNRNGIEAAIKILTTYPSAAILIVTAYDTVKEEVLKQSIFEGKRFAILFKPIKLARLENAIYDILESK
jgi:DNA-binding NtrC family response regulator